VTRTVLSGHGRRTETPNATMTTLASPTLGTSARLSLWRVEMTVGARGPRHIFDSEQLWTLLEGAITIVLEGEMTTHLETGDTIVLPAGAERQVQARSQAAMIVCGYGDAVVRVAGESDPRGTPAWIS
jgi:quercetin dioxygenase-like cupin family protein